MTCIIGYKNQKGFCVGGDSLDTEGSDIIVRKDPKVFKNGQFLFGCTYSWRMIQILMTADFSPLNRTLGKDDFKFMAGEFIDFIIELFKEKEFKPDIDPEYICGMFIVGYNNNLYTVKDNYEVAIPEDNFMAVGSGFRYALGAMNILVAEWPNLDPEIVITKALETAEKYTSNVQGPFHCINELKGDT